MYDYQANASQMYGIIQKQTQQIMMLEKRLNDLQQEMQMIRDKPTTNIERIDYKFDQLKIERLEGTLNIGLNPSDPNSVQNFEVSQTAPGVGMMQQEIADQFLDQTRQLVDAFLNDEAPELLEELEQRYEGSLDDSNKHHIIEDIRKQIDSRIKYYAAQLPKNEDMTPKQRAEQIAEYVKHDIKRAIEHFLAHIPPETKGEENG
ncbi:spore germination protein GerPC [Bacillus sp. NPDC077027]|uniref:spore germination protein GerPC n=1 Tax=Bacillus sp. NPDC077027 TaxID=3390548 RepID=UPI003D05F13F